MNKKIFSDKLFYLIIFIIVVLSTLHYKTSTVEIQLHDIYRKSYYIPIVLAALKFGLKGGLSSSVLITLIYTPHVIMRWQMEKIIYVDRITELLLFNVVGIIIGVYVDSEKKKKEKLLKITEDLMSAYETVNKQTVKILELEEKLHVNDRLSILGELSASLAHEIKNPLGSLKGVSEILKKRFRTDEVGKEFTDILEKEIERLDSVLNNYLSLAKKSKSELEIVSVKDITKSVIELIQMRAKKQNTEIIFEEPNNDSIIYADKSKIQQVLLNIIINAFYSIEYEGKIFIKSFILNHNAVIEIEDNGNGIAEEDMNRLFEPFFTTKKDGIGIGLTISKRIIEEYDGKIECKSEKGKGSTFKIFIPLYKENKL